ncbi:MFS transporter [Ktedonospora formicarum]|uniref:MFS transporter n=1 Tax=Ktedonospora formicarum TaxID=2778364 RepID=A0A8J3HWA7_9CHLR|nr:MFS transporter [Ktedonospora formicarum]GHO45272.1 MFS transporter [Ktedonospora formicarum]
MVVAQRRGGFLTVLRKPDFLRLWLAQLISQTIFNASNCAIMLLIEAITHSTTQLGLAIISFSLPAVLFGAPAGVIVDRMPKRRVLWGSNCLRGLISLFFVVSLLFNHDALLPIYALSFIVSTVCQFFAPAESATIPMLVNDEELMPALSLFNITIMLSQALGFVVLTPIALLFLPTFQLFGLTVDPFVQVFAATVLLYLLCSGLILLIPNRSFIPPAINQQDEDLTTHTIGMIGNIWQEMAQGWSFVRTNKPLFLAVVQLSFAGVIIFVISEIATPMVKDLLNLPANMMPVVFAPAGIGLVLGSILMPRIVKRVGHYRTIHLGALGLAIAITVIPLLTLLTQMLNPLAWNGNTWLLLLVALFMFAAGIALDFINIPSQTAIQEETPDHLKGRVLSLQIVVYSACSIPVLLFLGAASDLFGIDRVLYLLAACHLAFGAWCIYYERKHQISSLSKTGRPQILKPQEQKEQKEQKEAV